MKKGYFPYILVTAMCLLTQTEVMAKETHEKKNHIGYVDSSQLSVAEREANRVTYQEYIAAMPLPDSGNNKKEKHTSLSHEKDYKYNSKPKPEEIEVIKLYTETSEDLSFPPPTPSFSQGEPVSNFITVEMDVDLIKEKIRNKEIGSITVFNEKGKNLSFEYSGVYFDEKYPETFAAGFRNKTGRLTLSGHYGDTNFRGQFMDRGHTTNILIKNNKGYVYSVNRPFLELSGDWCGNQSSNIVK